MRQAAAAAAASLESIEAGLSCSWEPADAFNSAQAQPPSPRRARLGCGAAASPGPTLRAPSTAEKAGIWSMMIAVCSSSACRPGLGSILMPKPAVWTSAVPTLSPAAAPYSAHCRHGKRHATPWAPQMAAGLSTVGATSCAHPRRAAGPMTAGHAPPRVPVWPLGPTQAWKGGSGGSGQGSAAAAAGAAAAVLTGGAARSTGKGLHTRRGSQIQLHAALEDGEQRRGAAAAGSRWRPFDRWLGAVHRSPPAATVAAIGACAPLPCLR